MGSNKAIDVPPTHYVSVRERFLDCAPYLSRCSDNKTAAKVRPREYAVNYPYMQVNSKSMVSWLVFDIDHDNAQVWDDENLPPPNLVVINRESGKCHIYYAISPVCTSVNARQKPILFMEAVYRAYAQKMSADLSYRGPVAKTPFHPWWHTWEIHNSQYDLSELADYVDLPEYTYKKPARYSDVNQESRHCLLFEDTRFYAYSIVTKYREESNYEAFCSDVESFAVSRNNFQQRGFTSDLRYTQVKATVKSICRWSWNKYRGRGGRVKVMTFDDTVPTSKKQSLSAQRTHSLRKKSTLNKLQEAYNALLEDGGKITVTNLAEYAQITRQTVSKYFPQLTKNPSTTSHLEKSDSKTKNVNFGVHQIAAAGSAKPVDNSSELLKDESKKKNIPSNVDELPLPRSGEKKNIAIYAPKNDFDLLLKMLTTLKLDFDKPTWIPRRDCKRIVRVIMNQGLEQWESESVVIDLSARSNDSNYSHMTVEKWIAYVIAMCRKLKKNKLDAMIGSYEKYERLLNGENVYLSDQDFENVGKCKQRMRVLGKNWKQHK